MPRKKKLSPAKRQVIFTGGKSIICTYPHLPHWTSVITMLFNGVKVDAPANQIYHGTRTTFFYKDDYND